MRRALPLLLTLLLAVATTAAAAVPSAEIEPGDPDGQGLRIVPAVSHATDGGLASHRLVNGTDHTLRLSLGVTAVAIDPDEGPRSVGDATLSVLPTPTAELAPGETLTVRWALPVSDDEVVALRATTVDGTEATAFVARSPGEIDRADARWDADVLVLEVAATSATVTDLRARVSTWYGTTTAELAATDLLVGAAGRRLELRSAEGWLPGPRILELVAGRDGVVTHTASWRRVAWPARSLVALATLLLALTAAMVLRAHRRRPVPGARDEPPAA